MQTPLLVLVTLASFTLATDPLCSQAEKPRPGGADLHWWTDVGGAEAAARKSGKPLLLVFR